MNIIHKNESSTVGIVSDIDNLKTIGAFSVSTLKEWMDTAKTVYGDEHDLVMVVKRSENPATDAYMIGVSKDGEAPFVCCTGKFPTDGKGWDVRK